MKLQDFKKLLDNHDWFYNFSDDHGIWVRGERQVAEIHHVLLQNNNIEMKKLYNEYYARYFNTPSFVTAERPYTPPYSV
tara:strand:+ start:401 stop:637 length:237 start_codon:yes stop_codon:yes gene_type:complete